jgi:branched-chain amino acid transport system substrate-binding protein
VHAAQYSAVTHYLKAVAALGSDKAKASGRMVVDWMKANPSDDPVYGSCIVRPDGRVIHNLYMFEVKSPEQSKGPWDYYTLRRTIPPGEAFRPLGQGGCPLVRS